MIYHRRKRGRGFSYLDGDGAILGSQNENDAELRAWIQQLAIPPAWTEVEIDTSRSAKIYASGRDAAGKKQYIYNPAWRKKRDAAKYRRMQMFGSRLGHMRAVTKIHLAEIEADGPSGGLSRNAVLACMVRLIDCAYFRPGNEAYTLENESYGLTTMRSRHLSVQEDELLFSYKGKSGIQQNKKIVDEKLARVVSELDEQPGYRIFKYLDGGKKVYVTSDDLNQYISEIMGSDFSAKDFRTWAGTLIAAEGLAASKTAGATTATEDEQRKVEITALDAAATALGNSRTIVEENYIDPRILEAFREGITIADDRFMAVQPCANLSRSESRTLALLEERGDS